MSGLMFNETQREVCKTGDAKISECFDLLSRYVIHSQSVGPGFGRRGRLGRLPEDDPALGEVGVAMLESSPCTETVK
ncbi:hypothetical protein MAR_017703 [Mya arenaria]|uniref:Uncharacterized protein n=1 Tax=Mya arenaria TaxID=6604 RepID=A0ABY7ECK3_MYAAR|nr:hypothetical protein MAR_017703 [Mya arenaria]